MSLIIVRHAESLWNLENRFTGWTDSPLTKKGYESSKHLAELFIKENIVFDHIFTSDLIRTIKTATNINNTYSKFMIHTSELKERNYGDLTGMNKKEAEKLLGTEALHKIRRGYYNRPPNGESLEDVEKRVGRYFDDTIRLPLNSGKNVLIVAHGNSLRALLVHLGVFTPTTIESFELQSCIPVLVDYTNKSIRHINRYRLEGLQILDSRGYPTISVKCVDKISGHIVGRGSSPSGASCGSSEAVELRDSNKNYYMGKSVLTAITNLEKINENVPLNDYTILDVKLIDKYLCELDNTEYKSSLGGNTTTAVSFCIADVASRMRGVEMYKYISDLYNGGIVSESVTPFVNIINGGKHTITDELKIQEFMIFPEESYPTSEKVRIVTEVYHSLKQILCTKYGKDKVAIGDEGGFYSPLIRDPHTAFEDILQAIQAANYVAGKDVFLALDCAASEFYCELTKLYEIEKGTLITSDELIDYYGKLIEDYPMLKSIEDGFHETDYPAWQKFTAKYGDKIKIVGDDLFTTNSKLIKIGLENKLANTLLLKVNQIGTISEAIESAKHFDGDNVIVSHRSGETNHAYIIDIAKGIGAKYVKIGSPCRGERVEKFNRLLEIL